MLSLTSSDTPLVYQNSLSKLVTSLPYLDAEADEYIKLKVERMIKQEMSQMEKTDYLKDLPMPSTSVFDSPLIQEEIQRVKSRNLLEEATQLILPNTDINAAEIGQLRSYNETAQTIIQHNSMRQINLELMLKYGPDAHKIFLEFENNRKEELAAKNAVLKAQIEEINARRKFDQSNANDKLSNYQYKISNVLRRNQELEIECQNLGEHIMSIRRKQLKLA